MTAALLPAAPPPGEIVRVRQRQYLVEDVRPATERGEATLVAMSCLDDDAQGEALEVLWEHEIDTEVVRASWDRIGRRAFDAPARFAAYLHALRWNCVTATSPRLFQAPWRAGIEVMSYQLEPLRKALRLPRVNLFIADDVGLGKTIEAGLVLREMLMRQRVRRVVVAAPPSVVLQWRDELEQRFGLTFVVYDCAYVAACRRERGYAVNPWTTHALVGLKTAVESYAASAGDITSMGFPLLEALKASKTVPDAPATVIAIPGKVHGKARVLVSGKGYLGVFAAQVSGDPIGTWAVLPGSGKERKLSGYPTGTKLWVQFAQIRWGLQSAWSVPVLVVIP